MLRQSIIVSFDSDRDTNSNCGEPNDPMIAERFSERAEGGCLRLSESDSAEFIFFQRPRCFDT